MVDTRDELRDLRARAICCPNGCNSERLGTPVSCMADRHEHQAEATMKAEEAAGLAVVHVKATEGMIEAVWEEIPYGTYHAPKGRIETISERACDVAIATGNLLTKTGE